MWWQQAIVYHIYPLGFCGAEAKSAICPDIQNRLSKIESWLPHLQAMHINTLYLGPVFASVSHGYDTTDYFKLDCRLGDNQTLKNLVAELHKNHIRIVLDGVFNHVGRDFFAFADVQKNKQKSPYCDWFRLSFEQDNHYHDGFCYEGWDGCDDIIKLNLKNKQVQDYLLSAVGFWIDEFDIDGLRLDVAGYLNRKFLRRLRKFCACKKPDFWLMGEMVFGNYKKLINPDILHSITNYEMYKALHSSCNHHNLGELSAALNRQFNRDIGVYKNCLLYSFLDNHDVSRIASKLKNQSLLKVLYGLLMTLPGVPSIYYGSEWGLEGSRKQGDEHVRQCVELQPEGDLSKHIAWWANFRLQNQALSQGEYVEYYVSADVLVFCRQCESQKLIIGVNIGQISQHYWLVERRIELPAHSIIIIET